MQMCHCNVRKTNRLKQNGNENMWCHQNMNRKECVYFDNDPDKVSAGFHHFFPYFWTQWCWRFTPLNNDSLSLYACIIYVIYVYHWRGVILHVYDCWLFNVRRQIFDAYPELENKCNSMYKLNSNNLHVTKIRFPTPYTATIYMY